jgi:hypothetical protein
MAFGIAALILLL